ncbi:MAG: FHA domain-containing protein, partial [Lentisphaerota bacterium]
HLKALNPDLTIVGHVDKPLNARGEGKPVASPKHFPFKPRLLVGRSSKCDVMLANPGVSRFHAELCRREDGRIILRDLKSANGTFVNGATVAGVLELGKDFSIRIGPFIIVTVHGY